MPGGFPETPDWVAVYQQSLYAFPCAGAWRIFGLDGDEGPMADLDESVTLITAWNPNSEDRPLAWNRAANARLLRALVASGTAWCPAWGGSLPGREPAWKEDGFALYGLGRREAAQWGRRWGQRALVWLDAESSELLFVDPERTVPCGLRRLASTPSERASAASPPAGPAETDPERAWARPGCGKNPSVPGDTGR